MSEEMIAPLSGKILAVNIKVGQQVEEDEEVIIIEAMKMETSIYAPCDGSVKELKVKEGDEVEEDDVLAIIDEA